MDRATESQKHESEGISSWIHTDCHCSVTTKGKMDGALWEPRSFLVAVEPTVTAGEPSVYIYVVLNGIKN